MFKKFFLGRQQARAQKNAKKFLSTQVREIMSKYVVTVKPDLSIIQTATRLIAQSVSCIVVVDQEDARIPIGIVSERDFIKKASSTTNAVKQKVSDIMNTNLITISPDKTLQEAYELMKKAQARKIVVEENGYLVGIITQTDLVEYAHKVLTLFVKEECLVSKIMTKGIISVKPSASFQEAKKVMVKNKISALLVKGTKFEGILTEYDVVMQFYDRGGILHIKSPKELMHKTICCISSTQNVHFATRVMLEKNIRRLLILENEKPIGILTQTDITHDLFEIANNLSQKEYLLKCANFHTPSKIPIKSTFVVDNFKIYS